MVLGSADTVPSPVGPTGVLSEDSEVPPGPQQNDNISKIALAQSPNRIEVVTDAVPSPARPVETPGESQYKEQTEKYSNSPSTTPPPQTEIPRNKCYKSESTQIPGFKTRAKKDKRYETRTSNTNNTNINISHCSGVVIGTVIGDPRQRAEDVRIKKTKKRMKFYNKLLSCQDELCERDIIIVSETLEERGLDPLLQELEMDDTEADKIRREFKSKGPSEVTFQLLTRWKSLMTEEDQRPRLNLFSSKLLHEEVYENGGRKALHGLLENRL